MTRFSPSQFKKKDLTTGRCSDPEIPALALTYFYLSQVERLAFLNDVLYYSDGGQHIADGKLTLSLAAGEGVSVVPYGVLEK